MPQYEINTFAVLQHLREGGVLGELLLTPELTTLGRRSDTTLARLRQVAKAMVHDLPVDQLYRRHLGGSAVIERVTLELAPPAKESPRDNMLLWREPVTLVFDTVRWAQGGGLHVALVPALNIEIVADSEEELAERMPQEIRAALARGGADRSLRRLEARQRTRRISLHPAAISLEIKSPKAAAKAQREEKQEEKPLLKSVAVNMVRQAAEPAFGVEDQVRRLSEALTARRPQSVLLVGPTGVGKTAIVQELVRQRREMGLGHTAFWATTGSRLVAGQTGFGMWQERCGKIIREVAKRRAVLHLGNLVELLQVGRHEGNSQGIATFLKPAIGRGELLAIAECTPEQLPIIEREDPGLLQVFESIRVEEPGAALARAILEQYAQWKRGSVPGGAGTGAGIDAAGLDTLDRLHRRYATYSAYPGRPIRFIRSLLEDQTQKAGGLQAPRRSAPVTAADVTAAFARETSLPLFMLDDDVPLDLERTRAWFGDRVIGQNGAVDLIIDLLATVKARLNRPGQPIASLLLIGPTGVGKTEMAKALAEFLFGDRARMTRFDMSEYADPYAVQRLVGGFGLATPGRRGGGAGEGLLTAKVRQQPFAVLLFDEFEKAHPMFFDLLLQVLGDGRLTDAAGRLASFSNTVVIMTSNLGAEAFQRGPLGFGRAGAARVAQDHFAHEVRAFLRPELFNRIDRVVPFAPLDETTILRIARRELEVLLRRDGIQLRSIEARVDDAVAAWLARRGFDERLGARPLKRAIERELVGPLAQAVNQYSPETALTADVSVGDGRLGVGVRARRGEAGHAISVRSSASPDARSAREIGAVRRQIQSLMTCTTWIGIKNQALRLEQIRARLEKKHKGRHVADPRLKELPRVRQQIAAAEGIGGQVSALEDLVMHRLYRRGPAEADGLQTEVGDAIVQWRDLLVSLYCLRFEQPDVVTLGLFADHQPLTAALGQAYYDAAVVRGAEVEAAIFEVVTVDRGLAQRAGGVVRGFGESRDDEVKLRASKKRSSVQHFPFGRTMGSRVIWWEPCSLHAALHASGKNIVGIGLCIHGKSAFPFFSGETGLHALRTPSHQHVCRVDGRAERLERYVVPNDVELHDAGTEGPKRRTYEGRAGLAGDTDLNVRVPWALERMSEVVQRLLNDRLARELQNMIDT